MPDHHHRPDPIGFAAFTMLATVLGAAAFPALGQGGDTTETATVVPSLPYTGLGTTVGYTDDSDETCPYTGSTSPDVYYVYTPDADQTIAIDLCESGYDTKVYVYDGSMGLVACNDDACSSSSGGPFRSILNAVNLNEGEPYFFVIDGWSGDAGTYLLRVTAPFIPCPTEPATFGDEHALEFDGINDYVSVQDAPELRFDDGTALTLEAWIWPDVIGGPRNIITKCSDTTVNYALRTNSGGNLEFFYRNASNTGWFQYTAGAGTVEAGHWQHVAMTCVFGTPDVAMYVDGAPVSGAWGTVPSEGPLIRNEPLWFGASSLVPGGPATRVHDGRIDEVRLWNVVRTAEEIGNNFQTTVPGSEPGLAGLWRFEEGAGAVVLDSAGGHHGNLVGAAWSDLVECAPPCDADVDGSGDVGFGDILPILSLWGPCFGCPADVDQSGDVGFNDLLAVLSGWGPCPTATGACCFPDTCQVLGAEACVSLGGIYQGGGSDCGIITCISDDGVIATAPFIWVGNTCESTPDCDLRLPQDDAFIVTIPHEDDWTFDLCGASFDSWIALGTAPCTADLGMNDDATGCVIGSVLTVHLEPGIYYFTIEGLASADCGGYFLEVSSSP